MYTLKSGYIPTNELPQTISDSEYSDLHYVNQQMYEMDFGDNEPLPNSYPQSRDDDEIAMSSILSDDNDYSAPTAQEDEQPAFSGFGQGDFGGGGSSSDFDTPDSDGDNDSSSDDSSSDDRTEVAARKAPPHFFIPTTLTCSKCTTAKREIMNNKVLLCPSCGSYIIFVGKASYTNT